MIRYCALVALFLVGCNFEEKIRFEGVDMSSLNKADMKLEFSCRHEVFPDVDVDVEKLFLYARWRQSNNQLKRDPEINAEIERLYRIAAEHGHSKANINLQNEAIREGLKLRAYEHLRLSQNLIDMHVATGYYFFAIFLQRGAMGLEQDKEMALRFFRKAADEGSASAQAYVAERLSPINVAPQVAREMRMCAAQQGSADAAKMLGIDLAIDGHFQEALEAFQIGVASGSYSAASFLNNGFRGPSPDDRLYYLGQQTDYERADRYKEISQILANYSYANPKVPEINEIVPLPPAKLPPWDGKLQWLEERLANAPPPKPDEWLIEKLAKEKVLDPATGKPKPGSPAFRADLFPADTCESGTPCPQDGYWKVMWPESWVYNEEQIQHFNEGELMPYPEGNYYVFRTWPLPRKLVKGPMFVKWGLLG